MTATHANFTVVGMTCAHCVAAVIAEVAKVARVTGVEVDLPTGTVTVASTGPVDAAAIAAAVDEAGYELAP